MAPKEGKKRRSRTLNSLCDTDSDLPKYCFEQHFESEGIYQGHMTNGVREGKGKLMTFKDRFIIYNGEWRDNKPHGLGLKCFSSSGDRHEGYYKMGVREGKGVYLFSNGDKYSGNWSNGLMSGHGRFEWTCGDEYTGSWLEGKMTGVGIKTQANGISLSGTFRNGIPHGYIEKIYTEGDVYRGHMENDRRSGYGEYTWVDGTTYRGMWANDGMCGSGEITTIDTASGNYRSNVLSTLLSCLSGSTSSSGGSSGSSSSVKSYRGDFVNNKMHGLGTAVRCDNSKYTGVFAHNAQTGYGRICYEDSGVYCGECIDGKRYGQGKLTYQAPPPLTEPDHTIELYVDENNQVQFIEHPVLDANGEAIFNPTTDTFDFDHRFDEYRLESILSQWGGTYTGSWESDLPHGMGVIQLNNGQVYEHVFRNGKLDSIGDIDLIGVI